MRTWPEIPRTGRPGGRAPAVGVRRGTARESERWRTAPAVAGNAGLPTGKSRLPAGEPGPGAGVGIRARVLALQHPGFGAGWWIWTRHASPAKPRGCGNT